MVHSYLRALATALLFALAAGCGLVPDYRILTGGDQTPPIFLGAECTDRRTMVLSFNEAVRPIHGTISIAPELPIEGVSAQGNKIVVVVAADQSVGQEYTVEAAAEDLGRNSITLLCRLYGFNPDVPRVTINEFITQGSDTHPDLVELLATSSGNTAGLCICEGSRDHWQERFIFPAIRVEAGDYLLIHWKPQGIAAEVNETADKSASLGYDACPTAYDLWVPAGDGLSGNNGAITVYASPGGRILDAVIYSNRTSASDDTYDGFGSAEVLLQAAQIFEEGGWRCAGAKVAPEDAVNPGSSTATRSICRSSQSVDTDAAADWHIVPTKGSTFGGPNLDDRYVP